MDNQWYSIRYNEWYPTNFHDIPLVYKPITRSILDGYKLILTSHGTPVIHFRLGSMKIQVPKDGLVGGDWNHGTLNDFPETVGNVIIPTDEHSIIFQRGRYTTNQILDWGVPWKSMKNYHPLRAEGQQHWWKPPHFSVAMETSWVFFGPCKKPSSYRFLLPFDRPFMATSDTGWGPRFR